MQSSRSGRIAARFSAFLYIYIINSCTCAAGLLGKSPARASSSRGAPGSHHRRRKRRQQLLRHAASRHAPRAPTILGRHRCYFQIFTKDYHYHAVARELRRLGNATPLVSIEGTDVVSDRRRGRLNVLSHSLEGLDACIRNKLITGVATSVCQTNIGDLLEESWLRELIRRGVHYAWYHTYRPVGDHASPELALSPEQVLQVRRFVVRMRATLPIGLIDAYWDDKGQALCPMATGISPLNPWGTSSHADHPVRARDRHDDRDCFTCQRLAYIRDFRELAAATTRGA